MKLHTGKVLLAIILSLFLAFNPLMTAAASNYPGALSPGTTLSVHKNTPAGSFYANAVSYFNSMLASNTEPYQDDLPQIAESEGLLDPLAEKAGDYFSGVLDDEEFENILNDILDEIAEDERITEFDLDDILVNILRDEKLVEILGDSIATYLKDEDFLELVNWFTDEITRLLMDDDFAFFIKNAIGDFLGDERIVDFLQDIVEIFIEFPERIIENLQDDERFGRILADIIDVVMVPLDGMLEDLLEDERVTGAIDVIISNIEHLPEEFVDTLLEDPDFQKAVDELRETLMDLLQDMVDDFLETAAKEEVVSNFVDELMLLLEEEESYIQFREILDVITGELGEFVADIGDEVDAVLEYYEDVGMDGGVGDDNGNGDGDDNGNDESDPIDDIMDEGAVESQVGDFFNYWAEMAGETFGDNMEELEEVLDKYIGEDSPYPDNIINTASAVAERSLENFIEEIEIILEDTLSDYPLEDIMQKYEEDERVSDVLEETLENASLEDLFALIEEKEEVFDEVLQDIISTLPVDTVVNGARNDEDLSGILDDVIVEIPYDAIADLLSEEDVEEMIEGIYDIINDLPLDDLASTISENADDIGHMAATTILNGIADGIEAPDEPPDPRREAIMDELLSDERMHRFYLDLGADPETLTPESDTASVIIGIIMDAIEKNDRMEDFSDNVDKRAEPVTDELNEYGVDFGARLSYYAGRILSPLDRFFDPIRRLFRYEREEEEQLREILQATGIAGGFKWMGGFFSEVLTESAAAGFISGTMSDFLLNYGVVEDVATFERFTVINEFMAEIEGAEELKQLSAENFAEDLIESTEEEVTGFHELAALITPEQIATGIDEAVAPNIPDEVLEFTIEDAGVESDEVIEEISGVLQEEIPEIRNLIDEMVIPSLSIPLDFLEDERAKEAVEEIMEYSAEPVVGIMGDILQDPRLTELIRDIVDDLMGLTPQLIKDLEDVFDDPRSQVALENLIIDILTDEELLSSIGNFAGDLLSDQELLSIVEMSLYDSVVEAVYGRDAFPFQTEYIRIIGISLIPVEAEQLKLGAYNGLYYFTEVLMEWFRGQSPHISPSEFFRQYPHDYITEERVLYNIAEPAASLLFNITKDITTDPDFYGLIYDRINAALDKDPLGIMGRKLQEDDRFASLLGRSIAAFPVDNMVESLRGSGLKEVFAELTAKIPLEDLVGFVEGDANLRGIIEDTSLEVDPAPLQALLPVDPGIPDIFLSRARNFPAGILTGFFRENDRAYRMGYTMADIESRFAVSLLEKPELAQFQRDIILEKLDEADYTLAESFFDGIATVASNEKLADFLGELFAGLLDDLYKALQERVRSLSSFLLNAVRNTFAGFFPAFLFIPVALRKSKPVRLVRRDKK